MKKNPIIFIAMLIALAFTSCQMNTDDNGIVPVGTTDTTPPYTITVNATNGTVNLSKTEAKAGEKVFVESIEAANGYTAEGLEQTFQSKDGKTITLDFGTEDGKRYFVMPECNVVITVTFMAATVTPTADTGDGEEVDEPKDDNGNKETEDTVDEADSEPVDETPTEPPVTEASSYAVVYGDQELKNGLTLARAEAYIAQIQLIETTDYSIDKVKGEIILTDSGYNKLNNYFATNGEPTTTEPTDTTNDGVVYAACKILLPNIDPETGKIVVTNKGKDGNSVVEKVYKDNTGVYPGADEGDIIEIELRPDSTDVWDAYKYFEYENELTVKNAFGEKIDLTGFVKVGYYPTYTFTMPKTYVKVELPYGFEKPYPLTLDKQTNTTAKILDPYDATVKTKKPGEEVYVMVVGYKVSSINGLNKNETYKFEDITAEVVKTRYVYAYNYDGYTEEGTGVKIGGKGYTVADGSWDLAGAHFYSFIMPRDSITIKLTGN